MKTNHTPGPWDRNIRPVSKYSVIFAGRNTHIASIISQGLTELEAEANANLIRTAPELLDTLKLCEEALGENLHWLADQLDLQVGQEDSETLRKLTQLRDAWHVTCKVIAKAEGK